VPEPHGFTVRNQRRSSARRPIAHNSPGEPPCVTVSRPTLSRPPHSDTDVRDDRDTPLMRAGTRHW